MAMIDYGTILRVDGKFINKNKDLFLKSFDIGDKNFMLRFYKGGLDVISNNKVIHSVWNSPFISETFYFDELPTLKVEHLDKRLYIEPMESCGSWEDYVKESWIGATGNEKLSQLQDGYKKYKRFHKRLKMVARTNKNGGCYKYRTQRWIATWDYNGNHYEVIYGYGIDTNEEAWNDIKFDYGFTNKEREIIDEWFKGDK